MSLVNCDCVITVIGEITKNSPKFYGDNRVCISVTLTDKYNNEVQNAFVNSYFNKKYISNMLNYLTPGRIVSISGEISFTTFNEKNNKNNINLQGHTIRLIDKPWKNNDQPKVTQTSEISTPSPNTSKISAPFPNSNDPFDDDIPF